MAKRYYINFPPTPGTLVLQGPEARHLATVMRAKPGDWTTLFCGNGAEYPAQVITIGKRDATLLVGEPIRPDRELPVRLEVAAACPKGDRLDFMIEKLTELGVSRFVPLKTERSVVHPRRDKLERTVIETSKQCGRNVLMEIAAISEWTDYCQLDSIAKRKLITHVTKTDSTHQDETDRVLGCDLAVAIGPEGGWTDQEVDSAIRAGWQLINLGPRTLRLETAAIAIASYFTISSSCKA